VQEELRAQKALLAKQVAATSKLHVSSYIQKPHHREAEKKAAMEKYKLHNQQGIKRTVGFCMTLKNELEDLEASWDFAMKGNLDSDSEEESTPGLKETGLRVREMTYEDLDLVNDAIKSHLVCVQELKKRVEVSDGDIPNSAVSEITIHSMSSPWLSRQPSEAGGRWTCWRTRPSRTSQGRRLRGS